MKIYHSLNNSENLEIGFLRRKNKQQKKPQQLILQASGKQKTTALFQAHLSLFINTRKQDKYF